LVEDERLLRESMVDLIEMVGFPVAAFQSVSDAMSAALSGECALVLCDWGLPGESAVEFCKKIKQASPETGFVVLTGFNDNDKRDKALRHGADQFLVKPLDISMLEELLTEYLENRISK
jgi:DNA-binding response OmpR family regulator